MRKFVVLAILVPLAIVIVMFAVANREIIAVSFDPFDTAHPAFALKMPLFVLIFIVLILGVIVGGIAAWIRQSKWRRVARRLEGEVHALHEELAAQRRQFVGQRPAPEPDPLPVILPPTP